MKKLFMLALTFILAAGLSAGGALAKSDHSNGQGNGNGKKTVTAGNEQSQGKHNNGNGNSVKNDPGSEQSPSASNGSSINQGNNQGHGHGQDNKKGFWDVGQHWAAQNIEHMASRGLLGGYPDGSFKPDQEVTQAEALAMVMQVNSEDGTDGDENTDDESTIDEEEGASEDIPAWVRGAADKAAKKGIIKLNRFHSAVQASRAQTAVMLAKALGLEPVDCENIPFKDGLLISREDLGYIMALYEEGIMVGSPNGNFNPNSAVTRAQMACMLKNALENLEKSEIESVTLVPATATLEPGKTLTLEASVKYADGTSDHQVSWSSSDTSLATVANGLVSASASKTGVVTITATATRGESTKSATCKVTIGTPQETGAVLEKSGNQAIREGKIWVEYVLKSNGTAISLAQDQVKSITLQLGSATPTALTPGTDTGLWLNVQSETGQYTLKVVDLSDKTYEAKIDWTAPVAASSTATGNQREVSGIILKEYKIGDLDLTSAEAVYQIAPDGQVTKLSSSSDSNLWLNNNLPKGNYVFLALKAGIWYTTGITL